MGAKRAAVESARRAIADLERAVAADTTERTRAEAELATAEARGPVREPTPPTPRSTDEIATELASVRVEERAAGELWSVRRAELREVTDLLAAGRCPTCHQSVRPEEFASHHAEAERAAAGARSAAEGLGQRVGALESERSSRERFDRVRQSWLGREELRVAARDSLDRSLARLADRTVQLQQAGAQLAIAQSAEGSARSLAGAFEGAVARRASAEAGRDRAREALLGLQRAITTVEALRTAAATSQSHAAREGERLRELEQQREEIRGAIRSFTEGLAGAVDADRTHAELLARRDEVRRRELATHAAATAAAERLRFAEERRTAAERGVTERRHHVAAAELLGRTAAFVAGPFRDALLDLERRLLAGPR